MTKELIVKKSIKINADPFRVLDAITNPELTKKYMFNSEVISDWEKGSPVLWRDANSKKVHVKGIIADIKPGKFLATLDLSIDSGLPDIDTNYSRVMYKLTEDHVQTRLSVTEDRF